MKLMLKARAEGPCVLVLGMFDGVHRGHQALLTAGRSLAAELGLPMCVCTFEPHPLAVLKPEAAQPLLTTVTERAQLMASWGADIFWIHPFTRTVASCPPERFLERITEAVQPEAVVCGFNFTFGDRGSGTCETIRAWGEAHGVLTRVVDDVRIDGETVSSTRIRRLLEAGDAGGAARLLAHHYTMTGLVLPPRPNHPQPALRTANIRVSAKKVLPGAGVYACCLTPENGDTYHAAVYVPGDGAVLQAHVLDAWLNLAGRRVRLTFIEKLRGRLDFAAPQDAARHILTDAERTRAIFRAMSARDGG